MEEALKSLIAQGPIGVLALVSLYANWRQYRDNQALTNKVVDTSVNALAAIRLAKEESQQARALSQAAANALKLSRSHQR